MLDPEDPNESPAAGPGPFPQNFPPSQSSMQPPLPPGQSQNYTAPSSAIPRDQGPGHTNAVFNGMNHLFDPYDPMLDADPFGLSASMHFPTMYDSR
jgi:hypothetical protein